MSKLAVSIIVKDNSEASKLRKCLNSIVKHVDAIYLTGTNKPDSEIRKIAKEYGAKYSYFQWIKDFSAARNFAFGQVPKDYEWIFWCDCDDTVVGAENFKDAIALAEANNIKAVFARYLYQVEEDEKGNIKQILIEHLRERIIRNDGSFEWVAPIHETLIEKVPSGKTDYNGFYVVHHTEMDDMLASMVRNIEILENEVIRNSQDPRPIYYLAKAYFDLKDPALLYEPAGEGVESITIELMKDYIRKSGWPEERAQAYEYLSMIYREMNDYKKGVSMLLEAEREWPEFPSIYIQLALCYVMLKDWSKAMHWVKIASNVEMPKTTLVINPRDYKAMILECLFHIYINTGKLDETINVCQGLVELVPSDLNKDRLAEVMDLKKRNNLAHWTVKLAHHLNETGQMDQLRSLINSIPREIVNEPVLQDLRNNFMPARMWGDDEVVIYCGQHFENWSPKSAAKGIGGSEEAVINMGRELSKLGWKVTVYGDPGADEGEYDGVRYEPYYHFNSRDNFNILISWRQIGLFDLNINAKKTYLWNHDIQNPLTYTPERVAKIDKIMFLSKWHRDNVPELDESKVMYSANGINV